MKKLLVLGVLLGVSFLWVGLPRKACYRGNFEGYVVQVDNVTKFGKTTSFVVLRVSHEKPPTVMGHYAETGCEFLILDQPHRFAAEPAKSSDKVIKHAWYLLEQGRIAVQKDENIVQKSVIPLWTRFVRFSWLL